MTQNIEYIDIAENAIKSIEKISVENPFALLENFALDSVLTFIEFFDQNLRVFYLFYSLESIFESSSEYDKDAEQH
jgi:hypothetical protein